MRHAHLRAAAAAALLSVLGATRAYTQEHVHHEAPAAASPHGMFMQELGGGWRAVGMAQLFPIVTTGLNGNAAVERTELYVTQPAMMFNIESPRSRVVLRTTLNFEGITQPDGELTWGGWGEGFIDRRHPHTLVHEAMLSVNLGTFSLSAGKGFAPYGTDDPMSRPAVKYPTNHHLSQILERFTLNGVWVRGGFSAEAGVFGGNEPEGPYDFGNIGSFGNSWSARVTQRTSAGLELSASFGNVVEEHDAETRTTRLLNGYVRLERPGLYGLVEVSRSQAVEHDEEEYYSVLAEAQVTRGRHAPYARVELSTRPEYAREGAAADDGFYRYEHDGHAIGSTRWVIGTLGYGYEATGLPFSVRPFVELQHHSASAHRGGIEPQDLFGETSFQSLTAGFRIFAGGGPMRMGAYGLLDAITAHHAGS